MADPVGGQAATFRFGTIGLKPLANCPTHGIVTGEFRVYATDDPSYTTPAICPKCFIDFVGAHVTKTTPIAALPETTDPASRSVDH
jgi:hypothetical protein